MRSVAHSQDAFDFLSHHFISENLKNQVGLIDYYASEKYIIIRKPKNKCNYFLVTEAWD